MAIDYDAYFSPIWDRYPGPSYPAIWQGLIQRYPQLTQWLLSTYNWYPGYTEPAEEPEEPEGGNGDGPPPPPWMGDQPLRPWEFPMQGLPKYPTAQRWFRMSPSEQKGLEGSVETHGGSWPDYSDWMQKSWVPGTEKRLQPKWIWGQ